MKITKQAPFKPHPSADKRAGVSGVIEMEGEDKEFESRTKFLKQQQKAHLDEQIYEKEMRKQLEDNENRAYASQTNQITRMRFDYYDICTTLVL